MKSTERFSIYIINIMIVICLLYFAEGCSVWRQKGNRDSLPSMNEVSPLNELIRVSALSPIRLVPIAPGDFWMGSKLGYPDEYPIRKVTISHPFAIGMTEVTQAEFCVLFDDHVSFFKGDDLPVDSVSRYEAIEFCRRLTEVHRMLNNLPAGYEYRLPSEAEWEYCCRAGLTYGDTKDQLDEYAWYCGNSNRSTHPVGQKRPNSLGLFDMLGNVEEWCMDRYGEYTDSCVIDPVGHPNNESRVLRGGSFFDEKERCRTTSRSKRLSSYYDATCGFRVVLAQMQKPDIKSDSELMHKVAKDAPLPVVAIPAGSFYMGSNRSFELVQPIHHVVLSRPFCMGVTEVSQSQYKAVVGENPSWVEGDNLPVNGISWEQASAFCRKLTESERSKGNLPPDMEYRLPTEAEWEYCCKAGTTTKYFFGNDETELGEYAWDFSNSMDPTFENARVPHPVGTKKPNQWGLYDMLGNVSELCIDWYGEYPHGVVTDPRGPFEGTDHVWRGTAICCKTVGYDHVVRTSGKDAIADHIGFRVVIAFVSHIY